MSHVLAGLLTGLALIVAIGAQNAYLLRVGLTRRHVGLVVAICTLSDVALITAGVAGLGAVVERFPVAVRVVTWLGAAYLVWFGLTSLWRARKPAGLDPSAGVQRSAWQVARTTLALTWLNPHVYIDTVLMLGSIAAVHGDPGRWWFGAGAVTASVVWFLIVGYGARRLSRFMARPSTWRVLDVVIGVTMIGLAGRLVAA